jgi:hypothetical protein
MASSSTYEIAPDISDDEEDLVATSSKGLLPTHTVPSTSNSSKQAKGKGRALSPNLDDRRSSSPAAALEGRIGSGANGQQIGERSQRTTTFGGIKTETR